MKCEQCGDKKIIFGFGGMKKACPHCAIVNEGKSANEKIKRKPGPKPKQEVNHAAC